MFDNKEKASDLNHEENGAFVVDLFNRIIVHHALWFSEVKHQMGMEKALELLHSATKKSYSIQMKHLGALLGFEMVDGVPAPLLDMAPEKLNELKERVAKNWLVNDGVWFQSIEFLEGMNEAKRCNDSCWAQFSPFEASSIKKLLGLAENPGLEGLKRALGFRVYESINEQSIVEETETSFIFQMNQCRVQNARKRKGLDDYPCKSGGLVEYKYFARAIDSRIKTECLGCPPDEHPPEWFCAWKFYLE
ncbi:MAG: cytosolic protein [Deltaproteobacteria bacterium]|nr:cytosolic protein [Deltaproteobacteria bacterium]MBW2658935.1 cytosolic protein [Deltaproteobacteria bacterium]